MFEQLAGARAALESELVATRRALHQQPELAFAEHRTAELVGPTGCVRSDSSHGLGLVAQA